MRISDINQDNYKYFLQMLGIKDTRAMDALMNSGKSKGKEETIEEVNARVYAEMGIDPAMVVTDSNDPRLKQIVPVSDEVKDKIIQAVRKQFLENKGNLVHPNKPEWWVITNIMKDYRESVPPRERLAVSYTLCQVQLNEVWRLENYVKKNVPGWTPGMSFDKNILLNSNFGTISKDGVDVKA